MQNLSLFLAAWISTYYLVPKHFRSWAAAYLKRAEEESHGVALSTIAINMWKKVLEKTNLTAKNKSAEEKIATAKKFRELFLDNTYQPNEVVKEIKIVDSSHNFVPLEKQIAMFPEAGQLLV